MNYVTRRTTTQKKSEPDVLRSSLSNCCLVQIHLRAAYIYYYRSWSYPGSMVLPRLIRLRLAGQMLSKSSLRRSIAVAPVRSLTTSIASRPVRQLSSAAAFSPISQRRWASSAAAVAEEPAEAAAAPVWPERILPVMSEQDTKRLKRQRNVGM